MKKTHTGKNSSRVKSSVKLAPNLAPPLKLWSVDSPQQPVNIEILPLIDVIFCILTFFILAAVTFSRQQGITLQLPQASTGTVQMREMLVISLDELGQVYLEKELVSRDLLLLAVKNYHDLNPHGLMVLHASRNSNYNDVIQLLDMLREIGGERVALATVPLESTQPGSNFLPDNRTPVANQTVPVYPQP
jgi:biopolymer transport protein ExbD